MRKQQKPKVRKQYDKNRIRYAQKEDVLTNTFFYHGSVIDSIGPLCGNFKYHVSDAQARRILDQKNKWSVMLLAFCETDEETYIKRTLVKYDEIHHSRAQLSKRLDADLMALVNSLHLDHICSTGYFIVPDPAVDLESNYEAIKALFENEKPFDYAVSVLSSMLREKKLGPRPQQEVA